MTTQTASRARTAARAMEPAGTHHAAGHSYAAAVPALRRAAGVMEMLHEVLNASAEEYGGRHFHRIMRVTDHLGAELEATADRLEEAGPAWEGPARDSPASDSPALDSPAWDSPAWAAAPVVHDDATECPARDDDDDDTPDHDDDAMKPEDDTNEWGGTDELCDLDAGGGMDAGGGTEVGGGTDAGGVPARIGAEPAAVLDLLTAAYGEPAVAAGTLGLAGRYAAYLRTRAPGVVGAWLPERIAAAFVALRDTGYLTPVAGAIAELRAAGMLPGGPVADDADARGVAGDARAVDGDARAVADDARAVAGDARAGDCGARAVDGDARVAYADLLAVQVLTEDIEGLAAHLAGHRLTGRGLELLQTLREPGVWSRVAARLGARRVPIAVLRGVGVREWLGGRREG